ncbi:NTP pyrophosphatase (non-canonical NTP hydrolase) [Actimicrobium sp. GrIS 1.19]|uniref:nucleotide pyrophosphohydrolase n=1 Tax=Actimicrobium sp. GrIS 1.19 TaxID=3071708 RepID=UPI002DFF29B4|nr:NTP pyrophosphatase (non-canonical NTP hydrolase) [Actimicrobium sp. GrIS 1.19]
MTQSLNDFTEQLRQFRDARNWKQFHTLRNLIVSLNLEAAELLELTQWKTDADLDPASQDGVLREALRDECADVLMYLLFIADAAGIDLLDAARNKLEKNGVRYPVAEAWGSSAKAPALRPADGASDPG